jgi:hypothetical protein
MCSQIMFVQSKLPMEIDFNNIRKRDLLFSLLTFLSVFIYCSLFIWQGFDMSDEGHHLITQFVIRNSPLVNI